MNRAFKLLGLLFIAGNAFAVNECTTPLVPNTDQNIEREFQNVYQCTTNPIINIGTASSMTVTYLNVSSFTVNGTNFSTPTQLVFQVIYSTDGTDTSNTTNSWVDTSLAAQITITGTHRVKITWMHGAANNTNGGRSASTGVRLVRGSSTVIQTWPDIFGRTDASAAALANGIQGSIIGFWIDAPNAAGTYSYRTQMNNPANAQSSTIFDLNGGPGFMMLEEIP